MSDDDDMYDLGRREFQIDNLESPIVLRECWADEEIGIGGSIWSSSARLGEFVSLNTEYFSGKRVLELGSGCGGLVGICCALVGAAYVYLTDRRDVLSALRGNVEANLNRSSRFDIRELVWENPEESSIEPSEVDLIVAAECIYDSYAVPIFLGACRYFKCPVYLTGIIGDEAFDTFAKLAPQSYLLDKISDSESKNQKINDKRCIYILTPKG